MKNILIFAGTTEGRRLSEALAGTGIAHTICVATEYGEIVLKEHSLVHVHRGRMNREEMQEYLESDAFDIVVDATHPYAEAVTENIKAAVATAQNSANILYIRLYIRLHLSLFLFYLYHFLALLLYLTFLYYL